MRGVAMEENSVRPFLNFRVIGLVIRASGLGPWTVIFAALFLASSVIVSMFEPEVGGIGNSMWLMFQVVTTIGLGDFTAVSFVGRIAAIVLSVYSVFYLALITGATVSFCTENMHARRDASIAHFLYQLEHLPELSTEELTALSEKVKKYKKAI